MMYRAARSLVASSVGDENMSESSWREHYTGTDLFAFVTFDATLEAAVCLGRSEDSRRNDEKTVERWARRARFHSWLEWFRIRTPFARVPVSFFTNFILAVRAEDNTFFLPITASLRQDSLRYRDHFSFTNRIVTGAESFAATRPVPRKSRAVFYAESAGNTLLIAL